MQQSHKFRHYVYAQSTSSWPRVRTRGAVRFLRWQHINVLTFHYQKKKKHRDWLLIDKHQRYDFKILRFCFCSKEIQIFLFGCLCDSDSASVKVCVCEKLAGLKNARQKLRYFRGAQRQQKQIKTTFRNAAKGGDNTQIVIYTYI